MLITVEKVQPICNITGLILVDRTKFVEPTQIVDATNSACRLDGC
jgi:hypothetical protein